MVKEYYCTKKNKPCKWYCPKRLKYFGRITEKLIDTCDNLSHILDMGHDNYHFHDSFDEYDIDCCEIPEDNYYEEENNGDNLEDYYCPNDSDDFDGFDFI